MSNDGFPPDDRSSAGWPQDRRPRVGPARFPQDRPSFAEQRRPRSGGIFPIPHRSWQTSRGTRVTVGGCCLPLPIGCLTTMLAGAAIAVRVWVKHR